MEGEQGYQVFHDVLAQATGQGRWLEKLLQESTGRRIVVRPVVVFPGWFVEAPARADHSVWVLEPKALPAFIGNGPTRLTREDAKLAAFHLSRYIPAKERGR